MTTRFNAKPATRFGTKGLPSGYQSTSAPSDFTIPPVGIEDVDLALFRLFNEEIPLQVGGIDGSELKRVPVVFAAGEKWALNKRMRALRDRNNTLILPLISVVRSTIEQTIDKDIAGRGINQQTGEIYIKRKLDKEDRGYQNLINRVLVKHQQNLAVSPSAADPGQLTTVRGIGDLSTDPVVAGGGVLLPDRRNDIYETVVVPAPQFYTAQYDVVFWTQYTTHMNQLIEQLISSFLPQGNSWRLESPKGYWFIASVDENRYASKTNSDDFSQEERVIKYEFVIRVPAYILATSTPGAPVPVRRYVSRPGLQVSFSTGGWPEHSDASDIDDPTLLMQIPGPVLPKRRDMRDTDATRLYPGPGINNPDDPVHTLDRRGAIRPQYKKVSGYDRNGNFVTRLVRVKGENASSGETVLSASDIALDGISIVFVED